jgi:hypothetical protein
MMRVTLPFLEIRFQSFPSNQGGHFLGRPDRYAGKLEQKLAGGSVVRVPCEPLQQLRQNEISYQAWWIRKRLTDSQLPLADCGQWPNRHTDLRSKCSPECVNAQTALRRCGLMTLEIGSSSWRFV